MFGMFSLCKEGIGVSQTRGKHTSFTQQYAHLRVWHSVASSQQSIFRVFALPLVEDRLHAL